MGFRRKRDCAGQKAGEFKGRDCDASQADLQHHALPISTEIELVDGSYMHLAKL